MKTVIIILCILLIGSLRFVMKNGGGGCCNLASPEEENSITIRLGAGVFTEELIYKVPFAAQWHPEGEIISESADPSVAEAEFLKDSYEILIKPKGIGNTAVRFTNSLDNASYKINISVM